MWHLNLGIVGPQAALLGGGGGGGGLDGSESDGTSLFTGGVGMTSGWVNLAATLTNNATTASDGTNTASSLLETAVLSRHGTYQTPTITAGSTRTFSVYAKAENRRYLQLLVAGNATSAVVYAYFDLQTGTSTDNGTINPVGGTAISSITCQSAVNGFWKCSANVLIDSTSTAPFCQIMLSDVATYGAPLSNNSPSYTGNTANGAFLWRPKYV